MLCIILGMRKQTSRLRKSGGQSLAEFALILPILLVLVYGILEFGRLLATYSLASSASRNAARYGAALGLTAAGMPYYLDCTGMRATARRTTASLLTLPDANITINWDNGNNNTWVAGVTCDDNSIINQDRVRTGHRVVVTVNATYQPLLPLLPVPPLPFTFVAARSIIKGIAGPPECEDGLDNDGDGLVDATVAPPVTPDGDCESPDDTSEGTTNADCSLQRGMTVVPNPANVNPTTEVKLLVGPLPNCDYDSVAKVYRQYPNNTRITLVATSNSDWAFVQWGISGTPEPIYTYYTAVQLTDQITATAYFCKVTAGSISRSGGTINVPLTNNFANPVAINEVIVEWNTAPNNGALEAVYVDSNLVWSGTVAASPATIGSGANQWIGGTLSARRISNGTTKTLKLDFAAGVPDTEPYTIRIGFTDYGQGDDCPAGQRVTNLTPTPTPSS